MGISGWNCLLSVFRRFQAAFWGGKRQSFSELALGDTCDLGPFWLMYATSHCHPHPRGSTWPSRYQALSM